MGSLYMTARPAVIHIRQGLPIATRENTELVFFSFRIKTPTKIVSVAVCSHVSAESNTNSFVQYGRERHLFSENRILAR